jgi:crossover junction endodeoxyribonuclease RuvC
MKKIILGIDPGFATMGYGLVVKDGANYLVVNYGVVETPAKLDFSKRLEVLFVELTKIIKKYKPDIVAVEKLFFAKNTKTAIDVGQARGVILLTIIQSGVAVYEYTPLQIKQALTGYGRADKNQIQQMVKIILKLNTIPKPDDAADGLAVAICCGNSI